MEKITGSLKNGGLVRIQPNDAFEKGKMSRYSIVNSAIFFVVWLSSFLQVTFYRKPSAPV
jgi:hypothetical protein